MEKYIDMIKLGLSATAGYLLGGFDDMLQLLALAMITDYLLGLIVAGIFKKSPKTANGTIETRAGLKGLFRKLSILLLVMIVTRLEINIGNSVFCRNTVIIFFIVNEVLSILENVGLMGAPYPEWLKNSLEVLLRQSANSNTSTKAANNINVSTIIAQNSKTTVKSEEGDSNEDLH